MHRIADIAVELHRVCTERTMSPDEVVPHLCARFPGVTRAELERANEIVAGDNAAELEFLLALLDAETAGREERRSGELLERFRNERSKRGG